MTPRNSIWRWFGGYLRRRVAESMCLLGQSIREGCCFGRPIVQVDLLRLTSKSSSILATRHLSFGYGSRQGGRTRSAFTARTLDIQYSEIILTATGHSATSL